jgi:hypothetical protein
MRTAFAATLLIVVTLMVPARSDAADTAGTVQRIQGRATAALGGFNRPLALGMVVYAGDQISTGPETRVQLKMINGAELIIGDNSKLTIDAVDIEKKTGAFLNVLEGVFLAVTGAFADRGPGAVTVKTPIAVLGVRGTEYWGRQTQEKLEVALLSGKGIFIETPQGRIDMTDPGTGVDIMPGQPLPQPKAWAPARLERAKQQVTFD